MVEKASYVLSTYSFLISYSQEELLNVGYQSRNGNPIPSFDENLLIGLCSEAQQIFENESNILEIEGDLIIVGDIHGSLHDLLRILHLIFEGRSKVLFLGDYVDRGNFSLECITLLFSLKVMYPDIVYLLRGNHEFDSICSQYGFKDEILNYQNPKQFEDDLYGICNSYQKCDDRYKYSESLYNAFIQAFSYLPLCAIVNKTTFCVHGGLSPKLNLIDNINEIKRPINYLEESDLLADLIWSDPSSNTNGSFDENPRGFGYLFNREAVCKFLKNNSFNRIIRAHECVNKGSLQNFDGKCITVFSASSYGKFLGNSSSVLRLFQSDDSIGALTFLPIRRLQKNEALYYKVQPLNTNENKNRVCFSLLHPILISNCLASRLISNKNVRQIKKSKRISFQTSSLLPAPLIKPKFVTNSRKSYPYLKNSVLIKSASTNKYDNEIIMNNENNDDHQNNNILY